MTPTDFPQTNTLFAAPRELDESQCATIPAYVGPITGGNMDGSQVVIVAWQPDEDDIARILNGCPVYLMCIGGGLPPHSLITDPKFL